MYLALEAGMAQGAHNVGVVQVSGEGHLHGGPVWGTLDVLVLLWCNDLHDAKDKGLPRPENENYDCVQLACLLRSFKSLIHCPALTP